MLERTDEDLQKIVNNQAGDYWSKAIKDGQMGIPIAVGAILIGGILYVSSHTADEGIKVLWTLSIT